MAKSADSAQAPREVTGAFGLFSKSWNIVKSNLSVFIILALASFASTFYDGFIADQPENIDSTSFAAIFEGMVQSQDGLSIILALIATLLIVPQTILFLKSAQGKKPTLSELATLTSTKLFPLIGLYLLLMLIIVAGLIVFIVPGIIFIAWFILAPYIMVDKNTGIIDSLKQSKELSKGYFGAIWSVLLVTLLFALPAAIGSIGVLTSIVLTFMYSVALAIRYTEIKKIKKA